MARIAKTSGVAVGTIYSHFDNKSDLIAALGAVAVAPRVSDLEQRLDDVRPIDRVIAAGDAFVRFAIDEPSTFSALVIRAHETLDQSADPGDNARGDVELSHVGVGLLERLEADLEAAMEAGEVRRAPVREALIALLASWNGIADLVARRDALGISADLAWRALATSQTLLLSALPEERPFAGAASTRS